MKMLQTLISMRAHQHVRQLQRAIRVHTVSHSNHSESHVRIKLILKPYFFILGVFGFLGIFQKTDSVFVAEGSQGLPPQERHFFLHLLCFFFLFFFQPCWSRRHWRRFSPRRLRTTRREMSPPVAPRPRRDTFGTGSPEVGPPFPASPVSATVRRCHSCTLSAEPGDP